VQKEALEQRQRDVEYSRVCHPIGRLVGYMFDNKVRYGVLSSGTKTYFLLASESDVHISPAWLIGQKNYLRAWDFSSQACSESAALHHPTGVPPASWNDVNEVLADDDNYVDKDDGVTPEGMRVCNGHVLTPTDDVNCLVRELPAITSLIPCRILKCWVGAKMAAHSRQTGTDQTSLSSSLMSRRTQGPTRRSLMHMAA
jgi:hypothetical protein